MQSPKIATILSAVILSFERSALLEAFGSGHGASTFLPSFVRDRPRQQQSGRLSKAADHGAVNFRSLPLKVRGGDEGDEMERSNVKQHDNVHDLKFYTLQGGMCPYAARTLICLLELGLPFETIEINALKKPDWYLKINPKGKVPAIQNSADGVLVYESAICNEYLCDYARSIVDPTNVLSPPSTMSHGDVWKMMPTKPSDRAALRLINDHIDSNVGTAQYTYLMNKDPAKDDELREALERALAVLEEALMSRGGGGGGPYLMGADFTVADAHAHPFVLRLVVSLGHFKGYQIPREKFPSLLSWYELCLSRDSVREASPSDEDIVKLYERFVEKDYGFGGLNKNKEQQN